MHDTFLIGGSPSSGSTLLVSLLNKHNDVLCLPETGLFVHGKHLLQSTRDTREGKDDYKVGLGSFLPWLNTRVKVSQAIGLDAETYENAIKDFPTAFDLLRAFVDPERKHYLIEKTPENIFAFYGYLAESPYNRVVLTIRDALSVTQSLFRRGFTTVESLLIWFGHSYETARLIRDFPNQVYPCTYEKLTKDPTGTVEEIVEFLGISFQKESFDALGNQAGPEIATAASLGFENADMINFLVDYSSWNLVGTAWTKSPRENVRYSEPVNLLGLDYLVLTEQLLFFTADNGFLTTYDLENYICGRANSLVKADSSGSSSLKIEINSEMVRCLIDSYPLFLKKT